MENYRAMIRSVFEQGSVRDAEVLFETCIKNAFPTFNFRRLELIRFLKDDYYMDGRSWNHVFEITKTELDGNPVGGKDPETLRRLQDFVVADWLAKTEG